MRRSFTQFSMSLSSPPPLCRGGVRTGRISPPTFIFIYFELYTPMFFKDIGGAWITQMTSYNEVYVKKVRYSVLTLTINLMHVRFYYKIHTKTQPMQ